MTDKTIILESRIEQLESEKGELIELLKIALLTYHETVYGEWNTDIFKSTDYTEVATALQCLKKHGIEI